MDFSDLLRKYDVPTPRYTSYPTVPFWDTSSIDLFLWKYKVQQAFVNNKGEVCLYVHLPYCETLCTYCGCNKRITVNHAVEQPYITSVLQEWELYKHELNGEIVIKEIHLGGGTPTFFSPENLERLIAGLTKDCKIAEEHEFSVEVHPNYTTDAHLETLARIGFSRISIGVQDFDPNVQFAINRMQSFKRTEEVVLKAREFGFTSVNIDVIYGLPFQKTTSVIDTISKVNIINPDRIAFYSYAHVPWKSASQRRYSDDDVPTGAEKRTLYEIGRQMLLSNGMQEIGMDHFAKPDDGLMIAAEQGKLHRNFMGYTTTTSRLLIGLGVSSISDTWDAFAQNVKEVEVYQKIVASGYLPFEKGHAHTSEDLEVRERIIELMCKSEIALVKDEELPDLSELEKDGLIELSNNKLKVTEVGQVFIRNICLSFDKRYWSNIRNKEEKIFSQSV